MLASLALRANKPFLLARSPKWLFATKLRKFRTLNPAPPHSKNISLYVFLGVGRGAFLIQKISWLGTLLSTKSSSRVDTRSHQLHLKSFCCLWPWMLQKDNWHWIFCAAPFVFFWNKLRSFVFLIYSHNPETHGSNKGKTSKQKVKIYW